MNPDAVRVMAEAGVDIAVSVPNASSELKDIDFDYVVTVCDNARGELARAFPGKTKVVHVGIRRPAAAGGRGPRRKRNAWRLTAGCGMRFARLWRHYQISSRT